ncbi:unnamed protein product [Amoebophrya sp. A120]|nr:unnamed protein product [Amoebophrya sp. A120]|eukprot:GSA120T00016651001.1
MQAESSATSSSASRRLALTEVERILLQCTSGDHTTDEQNRNANSAVEEEHVEHFRQGNYFPVLRELHRELKSDDLSDISASEVAQQESHLLYAVCCFQLFLQANVTGPKLSAEVLRFHDEELCKDVLEKVENENQILKKTTALDLLQIDGEEAHELTLVPAFLYQSHRVLRSLCRTTAGGSSATTQDGRALLQSAPIWHSRLAFVWQRTLAEASDRGEGHVQSLRQTSVNEFGAWLASYFELAGKVDLHSGFLQVLGCKSGDVFQSTSCGASAPEPDNGEVDVAAQNRLAGLMNQLNLNESDRAGETKTAKSVVCSTGKVNSSSKTFGAPVLSVQQYEDANAGSSLIVANNTLFAQLVAEFCVRMAWYQCSVQQANSSNIAKKLEELLQIAGRELLEDFQFRFTGIEGIRRKHQTHKVAQLVVVTKGNRMTTQGERTTGGAKPDAVENVAFANKHPQQQQPQILALDEVNPDNDILETPQLATPCVEDKEDNWSYDAALNSPVETCLLLAFAHLYWTGATRQDKLMLEQVGAIAERVVRSSIAFAESAEEARELGAVENPNWMCSATGLWFRCKHEYTRVHTKERAVLQLQELVNLYNHGEEVDGAEPMSPAQENHQKQNHLTAEVTERLQFLHATGYPLRHELQREFGFNMMKCGMALTACEHFQQLKMWAEAVDCLIAADRRRDAVQLILRRLSESQSSRTLKCRLLCCLGDLAEDEIDDQVTQSVVRMGQQLSTVDEEDEESCSHAQDHLLPHPAEHYYQQAWDLSEQHHPRAGRSLGFLYFRKSLRMGGDAEDSEESKSQTDMDRDTLLEKADRAFATALKINPFHPSAWFSLGCLRMRRDDFQQAAVAFLKSATYRRANASSVDPVAQGEDEAGAECYGNLAACYARLGQYADAQAAIGEACRRSMYNYKLWESNLSICLHVRDVVGCCRAVKKLVVDLKKLPDMKILALLVSHVLEAKSEEGEQKQVDVHDDQASPCSTQSPKSTTGGPGCDSPGTEPEVRRTTADEDEELVSAEAAEKLAQKKKDQREQQEKLEQREKRIKRERESVLRLLTDVTAATANVDAMAWKLLGLLQMFEGDFSAAYESRMKEFRQLNAGMWSNMETQMVTLVGEEKVQKNAGQGNDGAPEVNTKRHTAFGRRLHNLVENLCGLTDLVLNVLQHMKEEDTLYVEKQKDKRALHFSIRNVTKKVFNKLDEGIMDAEWAKIFQHTHDTLKNLESRLQG